MTSKAIPEVPFSQDGGAGEVAWLEYKHNVLNKIGPVPARNMIETARRHAKGYKDLCARLKVIEAVLKQREEENQPLDCTASAVENQFVGKITFSKSGCGNITFGDKVYEGIL